MAKIDKNTVSLAGEFAVLSQLALRGFDANLTLGHTKSVDILISNPTSGKMYKLEVKTSYTMPRKKPAISKIHGTYIYDWMMSGKHESISSPDLFYCFVNISKDAHEFRFFIVPSVVVAKYIREEHALWVKQMRDEGRKVKLETDMRLFRIGLEGEKYSISTPTEKYEDNWAFK